MKLWTLIALLLAVAATTVPTDADARRFGSARSSGLQRNMPARTAPDAAPAKPATPAPAQQAGATTGTAAAPAAAAPRRSWMGPLAGLAAGLGLAALMSHLGLGEGFGQLLTVLLLAGLAFVGLRLVMRRFSGASAGSPAPAWAGAGGAGGALPSPAEPMEGAAAPRPAPPVVTPAGSPAPMPADPSAAPSVARAFVPAAFDAEGFARTAKLIFIRMQAANDSADLDDLRRFTTPELFASIRLDLQERGPAAQQTDVVAVDAEVLDVADEDQRQIVSVRFHGRMVEEKGAPPAAFDEVWHLVRPLDGSQAWAIAGIEQMA